MTVYVYPKRKSAESQSLANTVGDNRRVPAVHYRIVLKQVF